MNFKTFKFLLSAMLFFSAVVFVPHSATSQSVISDSETPEADLQKTHIAELKEVIQLLENPEKSKQLAADLEKILIALEARAEEKKALPKVEWVPANIFRSYDDYKSQIIEGIKKLGDETGQIPLGYSKIKQYMSVKENRQYVYSILIKFLIAFLAGAAAWIIMRIFIKKIEKKRSVKKYESTLSGLFNAVISALLRVLTWGAIFIIFYIFFLLTAVSAPVKLLFLYWLIALTAYSAAKNFAFHVLSPEASAGRVLKMKDDTANYIFIWSRRIFLFALWMFILIIPCSVFMRRTLVVFLSSVLKIGLVIMIAIIFAQWKQSIEKALSLRTGDDDPRWLLGLKRSGNYLAGKAYILAIMYFAFLAVLSLLGFSTIFKAVLAATLKSIVLIIVAAGLSLLWKYAFKKIFDVAVGIRERYPDMEKQVNRYVNILEKSVYGILVAAACLFLLEIWGLNVYKFIRLNGELVKRILRIPFTVLLAMLLIQTAYFIIKKARKQAESRMVKVGGISIQEAEKRVTTLERVFRKTFLITIVTITVMMIFADLGFDIKPLIAGAGIIGLAVGFGAQNLVRDVISGLFLIFENRIREGDVAIIDGTGGLVQQVNLRTTILRSLDGTVHVFPNGTINSLSNMTQEFSYYVFNVGVAYKEDVDRVMEVLKEIGAEIMEDEEYKPEILEPIEILGLDQFGDSALIIKARIKTLPIKQWHVGREMNRRIKKRFDELNIEIPFPHQSLYFGEASDPIKLKWEGSDMNREQMKQMIREVMEETKEKQ